MAAIDGQESNVSRAARFSESCPCSLGEKKPGTDITFPRSYKNILMLVGPGTSTRMIYHGLKNKLPIARVIMEEPVPRKEFLQRRIKKLGWRKVLGQILFKSLVVRYIEATSKARVQEIMQEFGLDDSPIDPDLVSYVPSVNSEETISLLMQFNPDVILVNGTRIISRKVLKSVPAVFINTHTGITPLYRGVHGAYWALVGRNPQACGVTVHLVDAGIDTGSILEQAVIQPTPRDNFTTYPLLQIAAALPLIHRAISFALEGSVRTQPAPEGRSALWSHPTLVEYLWNRLRFGVK